MGEIAAIWIKRAKRGPMDRVREGTLVEGRGLAGSANQGGRRQVTLLDEAAWRDANGEAGAALDPSARRANVLLRGIDLERSRGKRLRLGECVLEIYGEVTPCERMDEAFLGLRAALRPHWRGGAFAVIVSGGTIREGDAAEWVE